MKKPFKIRNEIKKGIKIKEFVKYLTEKAIQEAKNLKTGDILLVAGKGHEKTQDYGKKEFFFQIKR